MKDYSQYKLNVKRSPFDARDHKASAIFPKITLPDILDYRKDMFTIRDQQGQGACVAMAGSAMKEWQEKWDSLLEEHLSPQFIYNSREDPNGEGMYMRNLMDILRIKGVCKETTYPYKQFNPISEAVYKEALNFVIREYASIDTIDELKTALYINGPCVFSVPVYNWSERMWRQNPGDSSLGGHAMCFCGYNAEGFIVRNSWDTDWGQEGYCIFPYEDWGYQWEVWTSIDEDSYNPPVPPVPDKKWFAKY
jgi:C1A family cysteine protease